jgi:hypothetical protein
VFVPVIREKSFEGHSSRLNFSKSMASNLSADDSSEASTVTKKNVRLIYLFKGYIKMQ